MLDYLTTRRIFMQRGLAVLAAGVTVPTFLDQTVLALTDAADGLLTQSTSGKDGKILVVVQLSGGNDGLNTVIPFADDAYHRARPGIRIDPKNVLKINDYIGLHPNLAPLKKLYDDGLMSVVQGVGYPNPNRSHFRSMDIWQSAAPEKEIVTTGWLGRYFDNSCTGCDPHVGVGIGETAPLAMKGDRITPLAFERPESYRYNGKDRNRYAELNKVSSTGDSPVSAIPVNQSSQHGRVGRATGHTPESQLDFLSRTAMDAQLSSDSIIKMTRGHKPDIQYPGGEFGQGLKTVAAMIKGGLPTRVYYVSLGGFDTHAGQLGRHENLMKQLADGVSAFWRDIKDQKNDDRVLMMSFSEFGRRVEQNASGGTDHGAAAPMFFFGKSVRPGVIGDHPSLTQLDQGDLQYKIDFRSAYSAVLQDWLETPSKPILGQQFRPLPIVKT